MIIKKVFILLIIFAFLPSLANAADFYVDPVNGSMSNDGSQEHPWSTFEGVLSAGKVNTRQYSTTNPTEPYSYTTKNPLGPVRAGDTIYLLSGYHGSIWIQQYLNTDYITVKAAPGATPKFRRFYLLACSKWIFEGLSISPSHTTPGTAPAYIFSADYNSYQGPNSYITLKDSEVFSVPSVEGYTADDWANNTFSGVQLYRSESSIIDNVHIYNINTGLQLNSSPNSEIRNSTIENFRSDGLFGYQSSYSKIEYNTVKNAYDLTEGAGVHTDLMQFSSDGVLANAFRGLEIRGNTVIAHEDENQPFVGPTQGIGGFDGWYINFIIENNLIIAGTNHGSGWYGIRDSLFINNTMVIPWASDTYLQCTLDIWNHKNGQLSTGNVVRNTIAPQIYLVSGSGSEDHNIIADRASYSAYFANSAAFDFRLKSEALAIDAGSSTLAPAIDIRRYPRGSQPDIGAYEYRAASKHLRLSTGCLRRTDGSCWAW